MQSETAAKLDTVCDELRKRVISNRPFDAEQLIALLLTLAESIQELAHAEPAGS